MQQVKLGGTFRVDFQLFADDGETPLDGVAADVTAGLIHAGEVDDGEVVIAAVAGRAGWYSASSAPDATGTWTLAIRYEAGGVSLAESCQVVRATVDDLAIAQGLGFDAVAS